MYHSLKQSPFPVINYDMHLRAAVKDKSEIRFMEQPNSSVVCSYVVAAEGTFDCPLSREARGIVFNQNGNVISRPLHKFFNVNERPETHVANLDWSKISRVMVKADGSMIHTVDARTIPSDDFIPGAGERWKHTFKSKKSFTSDVVIAAKYWLDSVSRERGMLYRQFCDRIVEAGMTAIFEWTSPGSRIVIYYPESNLKLLHVRDNVTGQYLTQEDIEELASPYNIPLVEAVDLQDWTGLTQEQITERVKTVTEMEGWVIQFTDGEMVKLKTEWYMERHKAMTFLRPRDIAELVLSEGLDDLKSKLVGDGVDITPILEIESSVVLEIDLILASVDKVWNEDKGLERKDFAIKHKGFEYFSLLMQRYSGKEPDVKGYFMKHCLPHYSVTEQLNLGNVEATEEA